MTTIAERIRQYNQDRLPEYISLKYRMMSENAFRFFRGSCQLFYEDLQQAQPLPSSPLCWICGDLHLENFGTYKGNNRLVYFDLNDFDEAVIAPVNWELARMVCSIFTGFDSLRISRAEAKRMAMLFLNVYSATLSRGKAIYIEPETATGIVKDFLIKVASRKQKLLLRRYAELREKNKKPVLHENEARLFPLGAKEKKALIAHLGGWMKANKPQPYPYRALDACFRIAGTGSIGVRRYVFLVQNTRNLKKQILIDMKEARQSSVAPFLETTQPVWTSEADRVVAVQNRMQNISPALLGTTVFNEVSYVIRELQPTADKIDFTLIQKNRDQIVQVITDMAVLTASAQLRSSGRQGSAIADELIAFGNNGQWQQSIIDYALDYSLQVKKDYQAFTRAFKNGFFDKKK